MKKTVTRIVLADFLFIALLSLAGSLDGPVSQVVYYLGYFVPALFLFLSSQDSFRENAKPILKLSRQGGILTSLTVAPTLVIVLGMSFLTTLLLSLFAKPAPVVLEDNLLVAILIHAVIPAFLEELLFRFIPICLMIGI